MHGAMKPKGFHFLFLQLFYDDFFLTQGFMYKINYLCCANVYQYMSKHLKNLYSAFVFHKCQAKLERRTNQHLTDSTNSDISFFYSKELHCSICTFIKLL